MRKIALAGAVIVAGFAATAVANAATYVVMLKRDANPAATAAEHARRFNGHIGHVYRALGGYAIDLPASSHAAAAIANDPRVESIQRDRVTTVEPQATEATLAAVTYLFDPWITGSPYSGNTLTAHDGEWECDSPCNTASMTWQRIDPASGNVVADVTAAISFTTPPGTTTYVVTTADVGYRLRVRVRRCISASCAIVYSASTPHDHGTAPDANADARSDGAGRGLLRLGDSRLPSHPILNERAGSDGDLPNSSWNRNAR